VQLFISYSSEDREFVRRLALDLAQRDFPIWVDQWRLDTGMRLSETIRRASFVVACQEPGSLRFSADAGFIDRLHMKTRESADAVMGP
jgi:hypothetical protein